ncbi:MULTISPECIES: hypothetical protein [unclassified Brevibacterium]|uniref:hypothetical protein n=1 Tax=unclassified Brevibacterium TaxID=2614124 RepID=UPI001E5032A1|nr:MULTISPECIES: hypothetical protein [unclassified Brevibacterium]MCD1285130.1 hypothetical protein [Brevibacterium sp. CCUG 69071]MDK8435246.1 hypothetical protein [Brevibacterium sp. H-BE7]
MPDLSPPADSSVRASILDTSVIPLGERALQGILDHVMAVGDEAETTCLEVKGPLDMGSKTSTAKIVKFLLGAANRRPHEAARHFRGYAVLVIGAQKDDAPGVPRGTEAHELEDRLRPYLGPQFPAFEFGRIGVGRDNEVLFVIAQPPEDGQSIFPCHKSYQGDDRRDSLEDGAIYVRGTSNTRPARSGEVLALVERARGGGKPPIVLEVELVGCVHRVDRVEEVLEQLLNYREEQFSKEPEQHERSSFSPASLQLASSAFGTPRPLSREDREKALAAWRSKKAEHIAGSREHFLGAGLLGAGIRVLSRDRFIAKPRLTLTFHGCELFDHLDADDADFEKAAEPVLRRQNPLGPGFDYSTLRPLPRDYPVSWSNRGEDAEIVLTPESLRPNDPWTTDQDDYVIVARDPGAGLVEVSWVLTEDGNDTVATGEITVPTKELIDAADLFKSVFSDEE